MFLEPPLGSDEVEHGQFVLDLALEGLYAQRGYKDVTVFPLTCTVPTQHSDG